jgi:cytochrome P450
MSVVSVLILCLLAAYFVYHRRFYLLLLKIPVTSFPMGILIKTIFSLNISELFRKVSDVLKNINGLTVLWVLHKPVVYVILLEDIKIVLNSKHCQSKPSFFKLVFGEHSENMFVGSPDVWRSHRKILNPYFTSQAVPSLFPIIRDRVGAMMKIMEKKQHRSEFNIYNMVTAMSMESILSVMELEVDIQGRSETEIEGLRQGLTG